MTNYPQKDRLVPYKLLVYMLYASSSSFPAMQVLEPGRVRLKTGPASRMLKMKIVQLWEALYWLESAGMVLKVEKEHKRGTAIITLTPPQNT